jgi:hypothetical protein
VKPVKNSLIALFDLSCEDIHTKQEEPKKIIIFIIIRPYIAENAIIF